jgi:uncharacterized protein
MNIWFDLSNSPHINMFYDLIRDLEAGGHQVTITCRPLANTIDLLKQKELTYAVVGEHYGKKLHKKVLGYPVRVWQLYKFLKDKNIDIAVSQSSFHSPLVARLLGIPSIYTNDNEHAAGNIPSFLFATRVLIPENLSIKKVVRQGARKAKIVQYPGVKEGIYLWKIQKSLRRPEKKTGETVQIFVRPEPQTAQYYNGKLNFLDNMLETLQQRYEVTVLPRDENQKRHYESAKFSHIHVPDKPLSLISIAEKCTLFIGAGGSMTRELAVLGVPTISVYQEELLDVDKFLLSKNLMRYEPEITADKVESFLAQITSSTPDNELLLKGRMAFDFFKYEILNLKNG